VVSPHPPPMATSLRLAPTGLPGLPGLLLLGVGIWTMITTVLSSEDTLTVSMATYLGDEAQQMIPASVDIILWAASGSGDANPTPIIVVAGNGHYDFGAAHVTELVAGCNGANSTIVLLRNGKVRAHPIHAYIVDTAT